MLELRLSDTMSPHPQNKTATVNKGSSFVLGFTTSPAATTLYAPNGFGYDDKEITWKTKQLNRKI